MADPPGCVPSHKTLFIPNVTTDVGLSPPYNSLFTFFGQFFDHGVDQTVKSGSNVFVPLKADDPLRTVGPDGKAGTGDEVPASQAFMVLTRAQNQPGPDGILGNGDDIQNASNTDSPWVDQSQTYTSHASHQVFLRDYDLTNGVPVANGHLLGGIVNDDTCPNDTNTSPATTTARPQTATSRTWAAVKQQAATEAGPAARGQGRDRHPDAGHRPVRRVHPGTANGLPQYALGRGHGSRATSRARLHPCRANVRHFDTPFLTDIAHNADPSPQDTDNNPGTPPVAPVPDDNNTATADFASQPPARMTTRC